MNYNVRNLYTYIYNTLIKKKKKSFLLYNYLYTKLKYN